MKISDLTFTADCAELIDPLLALSGTRPLGAEIYTYCTLAKGNLYGQLWAGVDAAGYLAAALLDKGHYRTLLTPKAAAVGQTAPDTADFFCVIPRANRFCVMLKDAPAREADPAVQRLTGTENLGVLRFLRNRELTPEDEAKYVYWTRAENAGLLNTFICPGEDGVARACAQILAKNRRWALIGDVYTAPAHRGQGLAGKALAACEAQAAKEGLTPVLYCRKNMAPFYRAHGYRMAKKHEL